jgi:hypothetical protein
MNNLICVTVAPVGHRVALASAGLSPMTVLKRFGDALSNKSRKQRSLTSSRKSILNNGLDRICDAMRLPVWTGDVPGTTLAQTLGVLLNTGA